MSYYEQDYVMQAFTIYTKLAQAGVVPNEDLQTYLSNDEVYSLLNQFAEKVQCVLFSAGDALYMVPTVSHSPFHLSNDFMKRHYLKSGATNTDLYTVYFATIVLLGEFYNSDLTKEPTIDFLPMSRWVEVVNERINVLEQHSEEDLKALEKEFSYNWTAIVEKWSALDDVKEGAKRQSGQTKSRMSFLMMAKDFLVKENIVATQGNDELILTEKAKTIVQRFFMNLEYNNGILDFLSRINRQ